MYILYSVPNFTEYLLQEIFGFVTLCHTLECYTTYKLNFPLSWHCTLFLNTSLGEHDFQGKTGEVTLETCAQRHSESPSVKVLDLTLAAEIKFKSITLLISYGIKLNEKYAVKVLARTVFNTLCNLLLNLNLHPYYIISTWYAQCITQIPIRQHGH